MSETAPDTLARRRLARARAAAPPLDDEEQDLLADIAGGIDRRLVSLGCHGARGPKTNVSFVIDCRARLKERMWDVRRQRRVCAALERRYLEAGWKDASIYTMEDGHLRLRVTLRSQPPPRESAHMASRTAAGINGKAALHPTGAGGR